jgi:hypothetical protein
LSDSAAGITETTEKIWSDDMKKFGSVWLVASAVIAALVGLAAPAQADLGHRIWANTLTQQPVYVPHVDTTVHH